MSDGVKIETDYTLAVMFLFLLFWHQSGWYRVDCALGVQRACELIAGEEDYHHSKASEVPQ